jgi:glycosyltransferase involved in cell wall biosynthesis
LIEQPAPQPVTSSRLHPPGHTANTVAVIPAYDEARFIGSIVLATRQHVDAVIVVDDGSSDATACLAAAAGAHVLRHQQNQGKGAALNTGLRHACQYQPSVVITLDADGQHVAADIHAVVTPVLQEQADIVIGSRYLNQSNHVPGHRVWGHRLFNLFTNRASGVSVTDSQSGFRAFSPRALEAINFSSHGFSVESEMQFIAHENRLTLVEAPITIHYNDPPKRSVVNHGLRVLNGLLRLTGQYRPLLYFGLSGLIMLLVGIGWGFYIIDIYRRTAGLAIGYALICVLLIMAGNMAFTTGIILHSMRGMLLDFLVRDSATLSTIDQGAD